MKERVVNQTPVSQSIKLLTIEDVQGALAVSRQTIHRMIKSGKLRTIQIGRAVRIPEQVIIDLINNGGISKIC